MKPKVNESHPLEASCVTMDPNDPSRLSGDNLPIRGHLLAIFSLILLPALACGQALPTVDWNTGDGNFGLAGNWDPETVPDETERAVFSPVGQITVTLDQDREVASFQIFGTADGPTPAEVIFNLNTFELDLVATETSLNNRSFTMRGVASTTRTITFQNGSVSTRQLFLQSVGSELPTQVRLREGTTLTVNGSMSVASSLMDVSDNSTISTPSRVTLNGTAQFVVSGTGSSWTAPVGETHFFGQAGNNSFTLSNGATANVGRVNIGRDSSSSGGGFGGGGNGAATVTGAGSTFTATELNIGGGTNGSGNNLVNSNGENNLATFSAGGSGIFTLLRNMGPGTLVIDDGSVSVGAGGATLFPDSTLQLVIYSDASAMFATEGLTITDSVLQLSFDESFTPFLGQVIPLVEYASLDGFFAGISQDSSFMVGDIAVSFDYGSGLNDMISLTVIPEPSTTAMVVAVFCFLAARRMRVTS